MKIAWGIILSLTLHLALQWASGFLLNPPPASTSVEVTLIDQPKSEERSTIRQPETPASLKRENEDPAQLLSELKVRVQQQMRALKSGSTANRRSDVRTEKKLDFYDTPNSNQRLLRRGVSTIGNLVDKNIPIGQMTLLNTDAGLYYSFYTRVEDLFRTHWESRLIRFTQNPPEDFFAHTSNREWVTEAEIILSSNGEFERAIVLKPSGIDEFDRAATLSFAQVKMFPNPPKPLVGPDQKIRLRYSFNVYYSPPQKRKVTE